MFSPDTCEGQPEHPELVELSRIEKKAEISGVESLKCILDANARHLQKI